MPTENQLKRFVDAQKSSYQTALAEIKNGKKRSHWMWYIFPQIQGLGFSETSIFYAIKDVAESEEFLKHTILGSRLIAISNALLELESKNANQIFGSPDDMKLKSSMTLFAALPDSNPVFQAVLEKFFGGAKDTKTLQIINKR
ncbi:MAG: DUF1810 domain-containing protein [Janthinobacterium lividum]